MLVARSGLWASDLHWSKDFSDARIFLSFKYKWYFYFRVAFIIHCELAGLKIIIQKVAGHDDRPKKFSSSVKSRFLTGQKCGKKSYVILV